jgi:hypothetical protein
MKTSTSFSSEGRLRALLARSAVDGEEAEN